MQELKIYLEDSNRVRELTEHIRALQTELDKLRADYNAIDYRYRCEVAINMQLTDLCRSKGVAYRAALDTRPWADDVPIPPKGGG